MSPSDKRISRRGFLNKTAQTGLMICSVAPLSARSKPPPPEAGETSPHRTIDHALCVGCRLCVPLCPMGAISMAHKKASIDANECAECGTCSRSRICPVDAIEPGTLGWPRVLRETFSNPLAVHAGTGISGRGTEGIKTNDSQSRYRRGEMGVFIELGRPVLGARFSDVERVVKKFRSHGYDVIPHNPIAGLIDDPKTGALKPEILDEKMISCVIEFLLPDTAAGELMEMTLELAGEVERVFSLSVGLRADEEGGARFEELFGPDVFSFPNAKVNIGMSQHMAGEEG
jgi:ferredoxin